LSREFQVDKVRQLAGSEGPTLEIIAADWGKSAATDKTDQRLAFLALLEAIERGEVTALYAYATDRLARSVEWAARLLNAARRAGTVIVTSEGRFEPDNDLTDQRSINTIHRGWLPRRDSL
jgi:DNA invertase Pin-like site-specific DNA recombinase